MLAMMALLVMTSAAEPPARAIMQRGPDVWHSQKRLVKNPDGSNAGWGTYIAHVRTPLPPRIACIAMGELLDHTGTTTIYTLLLHVLQTISSVDTRPKSNQG